MRRPLQTLPAFRAVARLANLGAAAEKLHLTHSAVSQQIKLLEAQLGFAALDRPGRRVALNAAGEAPLRAVEPALLQLDDGMRAAAAAARAVPRSRSSCTARSRSSICPAKDSMRRCARAAGGGATSRPSGLLDSLLIAVGLPTAARRLLGRGAALADEPLLGDAPVSERGFAPAGVSCSSPTRCATGD